MFSFRVDHFPEARPVSSKAVVSARQRRGVPADSSPEYSMEDFLIVVGAAVGPMKIMGRDLVQGAIWAYHVLWPNTSGTPDIDEVKYSWRD